MKYLLLPLAILLTVAVSAQTTDNDKKVFTYVEQMPSPAYSLGEYLGNNIVYPDSARERNIEGRVIVQFTVDEVGNITDSKVLRGIGGGCDEEALRVIKSMPRWRPGKSDGKPVKVMYTQPISFKLEEDGKGADSISKLAKDDQLAEVPMPVAKTPVPNVPEEEKIYTYVESMPKFDGDLMRYLSKHVKYPPEDRKNQISGRVVVQFTVEEDGRVSHAEVIRSLSPSCDYEAITAISGMPRWIPGKQAGKAVKVRYTQPIVFKP